MAETVTVACKIATGVHLDLFKDSGMKTPQGEIVWAHVDRRTLRGGAFPVGVQLPNPPVGGYGLTTVDKDFWNRWLAENKDNPLLKNGMVFATGNQADTEKEARSREKLISGMEPIDPNRLPETGNPNLSAFQTAPESAKPLAA